MGGSKKIGSVFIEYSMRTGKVVSGQEEVTKSVRAAARQMKTDTREAQGAIALLGEEFGVHLPRHVRTFVASLPGADVLSKLLPAAAIAGLGLAFVEAGKKAFEWVQKQGEMGKVITEGFERMHDAANASNAELTLTNDKLEEQIAKITGKHTNNLKIEIDELVVSADKLYKSLIDDNKAVTDLIEKNEVGVVGQIMGLGGTTEIKDQVNALNAENEKAQRTQGDHVREAQRQIHLLGNSKDDELKKEKIRHDAQIQWDTDELDKNTKLKKSADDMTATWNALHKIQPVAGRSNYGAADQTRNMAIAGGMAQHYQGQLDRSGENQMHLDLNVQLKSAEDKKAAATAAKNARKQAITDQMQALQEGLILDQQAHGKSALEEYTYWTKKIATVVTLGDNYFKLLAHQNEAFAALAREAEAAANKRLEAEKRVAEQEAAWARQDDERIAKEYAEQERIMHAHVAAALEMQKTVQDASREHYQEISQSSQIRVETGQESPSGRIAELKAASLQEQSELTASLVKELTIRQDALAQTKALYGEQSDQYKLALEEQQKYLLQNLDEQKKVSVETAKEIAALEREEASRGIQGALDDMMRKAMDVQSQLKEEFQQMVSSTNQLFGQLMSGQYHRGDATKAGQQAFSGIASKGLESAEGFALKAIGLGGKGKLGSSQSNPIWTKSADTINAAAGGIPGMTGATSAVSGAASAGASPAGFFASILSSFIPMAGGGDMHPGVGYLVGENGPELMTTKMNATMSQIHASKVAEQEASRTSGGDTHIHVDARGATDPAAVHLAVQRGIAEATPRIIAGSIAVQRDMRNRKPSSSS